MLHKRPLIISGLFCFVTVFVTQGNDAGSVTGVGVFLRMSETIAEVFEAGES